MFDRVFSDDDYRDYDVLDYNIEATVSPGREFIDGRARLRLRVRAPMLSALTLRLADSLSVTGIASPEYGRLLHLRIRNQNSVIVNLPVALERDMEMTLHRRLLGPRRTAERRRRKRPERRRRSEDPFVVGRAEFPPQQSVVLVSAESDLRLCDRHAAHHGARGVCVRRHRTACAAAPRSRCATC